MSKSFPQYAKTDHPEVLQALAETDRRRKDFNNRVTEFLEKIVGNGKHPIWMNGSPHMGLTLIGLQPVDLDIESLPGRWTKPGRSGIRPYKNNPLSQEFDQLSYKSASIPGRGNMQLGEGYMGTGTVFEHNGTVYSRLGFKPDHTVEHDSQHDYGWQEIMPSEFHTALEAENERRKQAV